jgi:biotin carboxyl carrier protein
MSKQVTVIVEGREYIVEVGDLGERPIKATVNQKIYQVEVPEKSPAVKPAVPAAPAAAAPPAVKAAAVAPVPASGSSIYAPMPGDIVEVKVKPGDEVNPGDVVCVLEAMKMKNMIRTPQAGTIAAVNVSPGQAVMHGETLITFE